MGASTCDGGQAGTGRQHGLGPALDALLDEILPDEAGVPGALAAGTAAAVRAGLLQVPERLQLVAAGLRALDGAALASGARPFSELPAAQRQRLLDLLARGSVPPGWGVDAPAPESFWSLVRNLAIVHYYSSPAGFAVTGFPGPAVDRGGYTHAIVEPDPLRRTGGQPA